MNIKMFDKKMPETEAGSEAIDMNSYELAFHVLPTVPEGEVANVFQGLKDLITQHGGETNLEEAPARYDLAYEIEKYLEGRYRKFSSAYFGWVRFNLNPAEVEEINRTIEADKNILRHLIIRLTKAEAEQPFFFHEALEKDKPVVDVEISDETEVEPATEDDSDEAEAKVEDSKTDGEDTEEKV
jgi:ribosomal protein S6